MPLYEYKCEDHGTFERTGSMSESKEPQPCPTCKNPSQRILSASPFSIDGTNPNNSAAYERWGRKRTRMMKEERIKELKR